MLIVDDGGFDSCGSDVASEAPCRNAGDQGCDEDGVGLGRPPVVKVDGLGVAFALDLRVLDEVPTASVVKALYVVTELVLRSLFSRDLHHVRD